MTPQGIRTLLAVIAVGALLWVLLIAITVAAYQSAH